MCVFGGLLAGSYAKWLCGEDIEPVDFDIVVPHEKWYLVALLIPEDAKLNKFGGWRFEVNFNGEKVEVDVWPDTIERYLRECKTKHDGEVIVVDFIHNKVFATRPLKG
jgi:hypothetical protein